MTMRTALFCVVSLMLLHSFVNPQDAAAQISPAGEGTTTVILDSTELATDRVNLGPRVNSKYSDLAPVITPDEHTLYFTRKGAPENVGFKDLQDDEDIWYSVRMENGDWGPAQHLEGALNTPNYDGVRAINSTGTRLYLQNIYREDGTRAKGFSVSELGTDGTWQFPQALDIDDYYNDTTIAMMTISNNEDIMILSLKRKDTKGQHDLYISHHLEGYHWSTPEPIVALNTPGDELSPFIAFDDHTLYFSTNGRGGLGSHDIFVTKRLDSTWMKWTDPRPLPAPINTPSFDAYFTLNGTGDTAYFSSVHLSSIRGYGKSDIWKIGVPKDYRPGFELPSVSGKTADLVGSFRLDSVLFDVDKYALRDESRATLDKLVTILQTHPTLAIDVEGHTDSDGSDEHNLTLSDNRAKSVRDYLVAHGIDGNRVTAKGYGKTRPIAPNTTKEGKQLNRRVMAVIRDISTSSK